MIRSRIILFYATASVAIVFQSWLRVYLPSVLIPNITLFVLTLFCFYYHFRFKQTAMFSLYCGFLYDCFSATLFGMGMLTFLCTGLVLRLIARHFFRYQWLFLVPLFIMGAILHTLFFIIIYDLFAGQVTFDIGWILSSITKDILCVLVLVTFFSKKFKRCVIDKLS